MHPTNKQLLAQVDVSALSYFKNEIKHWIELAREVGIPLSVRQARVARAHRVAQECRVHRRRIS